MQTPDHVREIDRLLERVLLADDLDRAKGYVRQVQQLIEQDRRERREIIAGLFLS